MDATIARLFDEFRQRDFEPIQLQLSPDCYWTHTVAPATHGDLWLRLIDQGDASSVSVCKSERLARRPFESESCAAELPIDLGCSDSGYYCEFSLAVGGSAAKWLTQFLSRFAELANQQSVEVSK